MAITGLNHITLTVADLPLARAFYTDVLGATLAAQGPNSAYLELGDVWLCLERGDVTERGDDTHIALSCAASAFAPLAAHIEGHARVWKENVSEGDSLYFLDPDGHKLELHAGSLATRLAHYSAHPEKGVEVLKSAQ